MTSFISRLRLFRKVETFAAIRSIRSDFYEITESFKAAEIRSFPGMAQVTDLSGLNKDSVQKILQDYFKDPGLQVTEVCRPGDSLKE